MDKQLQKSVNKYLKKVKKNIMCDHNTSKTFLHDLEQDIYDYVESNNSKDIDDIILNFGTADDIAESFYEKEGFNKTKKRVQIKKFVVIALVIVILSWMVGVAYAVIGNLSNGPYEISDQIVDSEIYGEEINGGSL